MVSRMPSGWQSVLMGPTARPLNGYDLEAMKDIDGGTKPISPGTIKRFLEG